MDCSVPMNAEQQGAIPYFANMIKDAQDLVDANCWTNLGYSERALWGEYQGAQDLEPCRVVVERATNKGFCSCKEGKQTCKHTVALMLLTNTNIEFPTYDVSEEPDFVRVWLDAKKPKAKSQRELKRQQQILETLDALDACIFSAVVNGFDANIKQAQSLEQELSQLDTLLRQVKLRGLAARATEVASVAHAIANKQGKTAGAIKERKTLYLHIVKLLTELYELSQAYRHHELMSQDWQIEVRHLMGIDRSRAQITKQDGIHDTWVIIDDPITMESQTTAVLTYWVYGLNSHRFAMLSERFPHGDNVAQHNKIGDFGEFTLQFYPGVGSIRQALMPDFDSVLSNWRKDDERKVLLDYTKRSPLNLESVPCTDLSKMLEDRKRYYKVNPFAPDYVALVGNLHFVLKDQYRDHQSDGKALFIVDEQGNALKCEQAFDFNETYYNHTAGKTFSAFIRVRQQGVILLSVVCDGFLYKLYGIENRYAHLTQYLPHYEGIVEHAFDGVSNHSLDLELLDESLRPKIQQLKRELAAKHNLNSAEGQATLFYKTASLVIRHHRIKDVELFQGLE